MNKENAKEYLPLVQALAEGKTIEYRHAPGADWEACERPSFTDSPDHYRIKPAWVPQFKMGDRVRIIEAELGAHGANGEVGTVTNEPSTNGLYDSAEIMGYHVKLENGRVWAIGTGAKLELVPWSLSRHIPGFRPLRDGEEWQKSPRYEWEESMLPEGFRPMLEGEKIVSGDQYFDLSKKIWKAHGERLNHSICDAVDSSGIWVAHRTSRPLPEPPEPKKMVPLEASDAPPGSVFRELSAWTDTEWCAPRVVRTEGVHFHEMFYTYQRLKDEGWQILRPGSTEWQPCCKEVEA